MPASDRHLLIFARHPRLGQGKRRLAAEVGDGLALRWYRAQLNALVRRLVAPGRWRLVLAMEGSPARYAPAPGLPVVVQSQLAGSNADLGARMLACMQPFAPGPTLLIGSDVLGIERCDIADLFRALERPGSLLAPAHDGGFWALGHRGPALAKSRLEDVAWSRSDTAKHAQAALGARILPLVKSDLDCMDHAADTQLGDRQPAHLVRASASPIVPLMPQLTR